ncbi:unnamed protein product, partial [Medioppia subpectinata]
MSQFGPNCHKFGQRYSPFSSASHKSKSNLHLKEPKSGRIARNYKHWSTNNEHMSVENQLITTMTDNSTDNATDDLNTIPEMVEKSVTQEPMFTKIVNAFEKTLGKSNLIVNEMDIKVLHMNDGESVRQKYRTFEADVADFCKELDLLALLPHEQMEDNTKNWLDAMALRSCWWYDMTAWSPNSDMSVIRVSEIYGLRANGHKDLKRFLEVAATLAEMQLNLYEISLIVTYSLVMGVHSFIVDENGEPSATADLREEVLRL